MTIGRNAPCPCGSGKKYKKCCLNKQATVSSVAVHYRRLSKVHDQLVDRLMILGRDRFGEAGTMAAIDAFWGWPETDEDLEPTPERMERTNPLFWPWFLFSWYHDPEDAEEPLDCPANLTVAELYARQQGPAIDSLEAAIITAFGRKPYSFYEAVTVDPGHSMTLRDLLTGRTITVQERMGSQYLHAADIVFGRAEMVDGVGMIVGLGTTIIPPRFKPQLIRLRNGLREGRKRLTDAHLCDWDIDIRQFYLDLEEHLHQPPQLSNTDGDPLEFHKLVFTIDAPDHVFTELAALCQVETEADLRKHATLDEDGRIRCVEIPWTGDRPDGQPGLNHPILGRIRIDGRRMTIAVNSSQRATAIRQEVERRLGRAARFRLDEIQDKDAMVAEHRADDTIPNQLFDPDNLMGDPALRDQIGSMMTENWESWVDEKLPALNGKTPRQAVKTVDGREAVAALLTDFERRARDGADPLAEFSLRGIARIREILKLPVPIK